jgi:hypothetical protein
VGNQVCEICGKNPAKWILHIGHCDLDEDEAMIDSPQHYLIVCRQCSNLKAGTLFQRAYEILERAGDFMGYGNKPYWPFTEIANTGKTAKPKKRLPLGARIRWRILGRDNYTCVLCGAKGADTPLAVDHIIPIAEGGTSDDTNLRTLCKDCNSGKGALDPRNGDR